MSGGVQHGDPADSWLSSAIAIGNAHLSEIVAYRNLQGFVIDFVKAHNRIVRAITFKVATRLGVPDLAEPGIHPHLVLLDSA